MLCNTEKQNSQCERRTTNEANTMLYLPLFVFHVRITCAEPEGGGVGGLNPPPLKNHKAIRFLSNTCPDPLENHKAIRFLSNTGPDPLENHKAASQYSICTTRQSSC